MVKAGARPVSYIRVSAGILIRNGRVLIAKRPLHCSDPGMWEFPGGKIERGDTPAQALEREFLEELGVNPKKYLLWQEKRHFFKGRYLWIYFFLVHLFEGEPSPVQGQDLRWISPWSEMPEIDFLPSDRKVFSSLQRLLISG